MKSSIATGTLLFCLMTTCYGAGINRIVGGSDAPENKYPYQTYLGDATGYLCGATIISKHYLVTAGHCVIGLSPDKVHAVLGTVNVNNGKGQIHGVESFSLHDDYKRPTGDYAVNDIALVRVQRDIMFTESVQPVQLPSRDYAISDDSAVNFSGWGTLQTENSSTKYPREFLPNP